MSSPELYDPRRGDLDEPWRRNQAVPEGISQCVHHLIKAIAGRNPLSPAICAWDGQMSYGELDELSTRLAGYLIGLGVKPEEIVPLCFEKSKWTIVAMLAVLKAGGAFAPLNPEYPRTRLETLLGQIKARVMLMSAQCSAVWAGSEQTIVTVSGQSIGQLASGTDESFAAVKPDNAAYVMFTSGSTGTPKGVILEHGAVSTSCLAHGQVFGLAQQTRALQFADYTFDVCITEILTTLVFGGCVCVPSEFDRRNRLTEAIAAMDVNLALLTPSVTRLLKPSMVPSLKVLVLAGEQVTCADWIRWQDYLQVINGYGPTEACVFCVAFTGPSHFKLGTIGKPIASVSWVVDPEDHHILTPMGSVGELLVEGPILARGYLNDPETTSAAFIAAPAWLSAGGAGVPGRHGRLYKTGDLVRYDAAGNLVYIGRKDTQVKVRGQRVELGEIEHHLRECLPEAKQVVVETISPKGGSGSAAVAAFLHWGDEGPDTTGLPARMVFPSGIDERLAERLPSYMVPGVYFDVGAMPITASGKTDRKRLREIGASFSAQQLAEMRTSGQGQKRTPSTEAERTMQQLWGQVLNIAPESIGLDDSFFRLGGDSIAAMKLVGEARRTGIELTVADLFRNPRLDQSASVANTSANNSLTMIPHANHPGPAEQSFAQRRLWFLEQLYPGLTWYLIPFAVRIRGPLQLASLHQALLAVESRHEMLRTTFATHGDSNLQYVLPFRMKELHIVDVLPGDAHDLLSAVQQDQTTPFDLRNEPGWRVKVYRVSPDDHVLSIVMHHIVSDGWSVDILMRELAVFYSAAIRGEDPLSQVPPLPIQYGDFSRWQRQQAQIEEHQRQLGYWRAQLQASRPAELLCDKPRSPTLSGKAGRQTLYISDLLHTEVQKFCRAHEVTLFVALFAVFRAVHYRLTGQDDATIGTVNANRDRWELRDMIGFFVNMQCLRTMVKEDMTFQELVQQVNAVNIASLANQDVPFEKIVSSLSTDRDLSRHPLVQLVFVVHSQQDLDQLKLEGMETESLHALAATRFDLEFHFYQEPNGLRGDVMFSTDLYASETISNMLSLFHKTLEECLKEPRAVVVTLPLWTDVDHSKLNGMGLLHVEKTAYPRESSIVDLFHQQASACPSRVAVKDSLGTMTYA
ncbi:Nonribosomal peptide synthetase 3, partial [Podospora australis]